MKQSASGLIIAAVVFGYLAAMASVLTWKATAGTLPPLWLHIPLVVGAGLWAWWRWEGRA